MLNYDVICIGDAKLDALLKIADDNPKCRINKDTNEICFKHGEKISVEHTKLSIGGNAANVCVGLKRLGINSTIAAEIGDDEFSLKIINTLAREGIDRGFIQQRRGQESSISIAINFSGDRTLLTEHVDRPHEFNYEFSNFKLIYLTSLGEIWEKAYEKAINYKSAHNNLLAFNPGTKQITEKSIVIEKALKSTDLLFINKEEAMLLISHYVDSIDNPDIQDILMKIKSIVPGIAIVTDGKDGSYAIDQNNKIYHQEEIPCTIVEFTGAGDSYSAGFIASFLQGFDIQTSMLWGTLNSISVIGKVGAQDGLLGKEEMEKKINEYR